MAILPSAIWRIRPAGNVLNGAAFNPTISGAGTDYSQQDSPQLSLTDLNSSGTTITSATGGFTSAMIGNALQTAAGAFYFITARTDTNTITVDRTVSPALTGSAGRVGGAWGGSSGVNPFYIADNSKGVTARPVIGSTVYIYGSGSDTPGSADYTFTGTTNALDGWANPVVGDTTNGPIRYIGENGRPRIHGTGLMVSATRCYFENLYLYATSNSNPHTGMLRTAASYIGNVHVNTNAQDTVVGLGVSGGIVVNCEIWSGTTSPSSSSGAYGIRCPNSGGTASEHVVIASCKIHHMGDAGIYIANNALPVVRNCWIYSNKVHGIHFTASDQAQGACFDNNVLDGNDLEGFVATTAAGFFSVNMFTNNIMSNNRFGFAASSGSAALIAALRKLNTNNFYYGNTTNRTTNFAASPDDVDLTVDPFVDASTFDFRLNGKALGGNLVRKVGFPKLLGTYPASSGGTRMTWPDGGATQEKNTPTLLVSGF